MPELRQSNTFDASNTIRIFDVYSTVLKMQWQDKTIGSSAIGICLSDKYSSRNAAYWILSRIALETRCRLRAHTNRQCYLTFALWPEAWLYIYPENFETRCLKSDSRTYFSLLSNCPIAQRCRPFARHDWYVRVILHWLRTRETSELLKRSIWCSKRPVKIQPSCVFWRVGCLSEDLTWPTHIRFQNNSD